MVVYEVDNSTMINVIMKTGEAIEAAVKNISGKVLEDGGVAYGNGNWIYNKTRH